MLSKGGTPVTTRDCTAEELDDRALHAARRRREESFLRFATDLEKFDLDPDTLERATARAIVAATERHNWVG